jgi:two-component system phosphate regulon response regulator PhoB
MATIFLVEDNALIRDGVTEFFELHDYHMVTFDRGAGVVEAFRDQSPDAIILDVMLPDTSGFSVAQELRRITEVPILFLTARDAESHRVMGFEIGGDDYIVKPFSVKELLLRTEAVLRRTTTGSEPPRVQQWHHGESLLTVDRDRRVVELNGASVSLTNAEWEILTFLTDRADRAVSREHILTECLGYQYTGSERTVDTHIANIRTRLSDSSWVETVRGFGYRFVGNRD